MFEHVGMVRLPDEDAHMQRALHKPHKVAWNHR